MRAATASVGTHVIGDPLVTVVGAHLKNLRVGSDAGGYCAKAAGTKRAGMSTAR